MDQISIVIPTHERLDALSRTLTSIAAQDLCALDVELVIVCSGSSNHYRHQVGELISTLSLPARARALARAEGGAAGARNHGVAAADGELILFLNDDTSPAASDLVRRHAEAHEERPDKWRGVLGRVSWHPEIAATPVMDWMDRAGRMNDYSALEAEGSRRPMLYAPNLSIRRSALVAVGGFDERFSTYGWEEYDLALRLSDHGFRVEYRPGLVAWHYHRYTLRDSLRRMDAVGRAANLLNRVHSTRDGLSTPDPTGAMGRVARMVAPAALSIPVPTWTPRALRDHLFRALHYAALARGYSRPPLLEGAGMKGGIPAPDTPATTQ